ncbi:recQ-mediated genome instability protein 1 [Siniperca chuatsi]|uniref:recQ-mediated genome instability protein 1 n=1 Tax=Siniperca chuatsi TaxID=119488 RepID=UPI001CE1658C|nr:recQ-mediated genome instability protein 1 [Siniperca chuatsi]XP_044051346.1 recQ-mediated genome instability protein 1 [Siniperca chuatsi]XP_044051348.1 recQ-mediated genome instability protein 1 [Siniperca chuatsi]XP_044051349.1 recQ-mediated genome instability protein 1 [Siniperca chuatsi]XP_044051350.1 recQ-mediated genome instability protein 1 [Siniperca chuatsi]XP_044051351.1 recQ-mediated genome instability protein 1 [Siniperca chuatsi]XP_044051352.1 recQ-mediated genome instability
MAPEIQAVVHATQAWLQSSWHIHVPFAWLEACVEWLQEEAGGAGHLSQQQINQQALDQWLLTDLRDLDYPVLPEGLTQAQKTELRGTFCVQVDSLLDISQPAYGQLQKWRGADCANDEVSAVTQTTQRPWEARQTRMLLLQVTDGVQSLEAMEYQSIPALSTALRPGVKLQLKGQIVCRLGVLLLGPSNIKVLGGEVEDLVDRNNKGSVLCRTLGLPEEQQQQEGEEAPTAPQQGNQEVEDLELDDAELLASLEAQEEVGRVQAGPVRDSGYGTLSETSTQSSRNSYVRSLVSTASSRSGLTESNRGDSVQGHRHGNEQEDSDLFDHLTQQEIPDHNMADEDFPDEDFDDLPLDELDGVIFQESTKFNESSHRSMPQNNNWITRNPNGATKPQTAPTEQPTLNGSGSRLGSSNSRSTTQKRDYQGCSRGATEQLFTPAASEPSHKLEFVTNDESDFMDEDIDCKVETYRVQTGRTGGPNQLPVYQGPSRDNKSATNKTELPGSSCRLTGDSSRSITSQGQSYTSSTAEFDRLCAKKGPQSDSLGPALSLTSPPFTYLCLLEEMMSKPHTHTKEICVKAFIVTLLGKLSSNNGLWRVCATISDGTGYLDVELSDEVLTGLLGFSVAEKGALKRDPARRGELDTGMRRCQEELVDMCCVMRIVVELEGRKAVVTKADPVNEKVVQELEQRVRDRQK